MITLTDLRALLERALTHAENPAIVRLADRTVEGLARAYLPRLTWWTIPPAPVAHGMFMGSAFTSHADTLDMLRKAPLGEVLTCEAALTDPGTAHALLVALALALGLDPGVGGIGCSWRPDGPGWRLEGVAATLAQRGCVWFEQRDQDQLDDATDPGGGDGPLETAHTLFLHAPTIAAEPDPIKALALAVRHVLENP